MKNQNLFTSSFETSVSGKFSASLIDYQTDIKQSWHRHDEFILAMVLRGKVREQVKCQDTLVQEFDVGVKSPDVRHTDHFCPKGVRVIRLSISPKFVAELKSQLLINEGWYWLKASNAVRQFLQIGQSLLAKNDRIEDDVHELIASLLPNNNLLKNSHPPFWLRRAGQQLDETFLEGVRLKQLAENAGVHPVYFARKFKEFYGCSVGTYTCQLQFREVQNLIVSGKRNLAQIAVEAGFSDQSHLTRTFNDEFGITPAKFRKLLS